MIRHKVLFVKPAILTVLLLAATSGVAQQGGGAPSRNEIHPKSVSAQDVSENAADVLKRVAQSMGRYARDVSEIPLKVETTIIKYEPSGKEKHKQSSSHTMQFVKRSYPEGKIRRQVRSGKPGLHRVSKDEANGDSATAVLALVFDNSRLDPAFRYSLILHVISKRLEAKITDDRPCEGFDANVVDERDWCGETNLVLDSATLDPLSASYVAGGFPRTFGKVRYLSFSFVEEFQKVTINGSKESFLLPGRVTVKYESDQGRTVIESKYSVKQKSPFSQALGQYSGKSELN